MRRLASVVCLGCRLLGVTAVIVTLVVLLGIGIGPPTGAYQVRTVLTGSMRPTMPEGSVVIVVPVRPSRLGVDDVITYRIPVEDRRIVTHRIVEIVEPGPEPVVRTKGDANNAPDQWVARLRGDEAWRVQLSVPKVGYVLSVLRRPALFKLTVLVAPLLFALTTVVRIWIPPKTDDQRREHEDDRPDDQQPRQPKQPQERPGSQRRPDKRRVEPASRELTQEERWQEWRERRARPREAAPVSHV